MNRSNLLMLLIIAAAAAGFWMLSPTHAQHAAGSARNSVAIVNVPLVFRSCKETTAMNRDLEAKTRQVQANMDAQAGRLKKMEEDIRQNFAPDSKDFNDKMRELLAERIRMRVTVEEQQRDIIIEQQMRAEAFYAKINRHVQAIALADGFDIVLFHEDFAPKDAQGPEQLLDMIRQHKVIYNSPRADITKPVIDRLDADFVDRK